MQRRNGFSLIELMIVIALFAILAGMALPTFQTMIQNGRITSATNSQLGFLQLARSEAVKRRSNIIVCGSNNQTSCNDNWEQGAIILQGANVLKVLPPAATGVAVRGSGNSLTYNSDGTIVAAAAISICDARGVPSSRSIAITFIGQASSGANNACP